MPKRFEQPEIAYSDDEVETVDEPVPKPEPKVVRRVKKEVETVKEVSKELDDSDSEDEVIELKRPKITPHYKLPPKQKKEKDPDQPKKERTQAQKDAWARCLSAKQAKREERGELRKQELAEVEKYKKNLEKMATKKVIKKAINLKKKQVVVDEVIDDLSDGEEIPIEVVTKKIKEKRKQMKKMYSHESTHDDDFVSQPAVIRFV